MLGGGRSQGEDWYDNFMPALGKITDGQIRTFSKAIAGTLFVRNIGMSVSLLKQGGASDKTIQALIKNIDKNGDGSLVDELGAAAIIGAEHTSIPDGTKITLSDDAKTMESYISGRTRGNSTTVSGDDFFQALSRLTNNKDILDPDVRADIKKYIDWRENMQRDNYAKYHDFTLMLPHMPADAFSREIVQMFSGNDFQEQFEGIYKTPYYIIDGPVQTFNNNS